MCVKMQLIQFNAHLLGEKDGSEFEEATSETDEQTEIKSEDQANSPQISLTAAAGCWQAYPCCPS